MVVCCSVGAHHFKAPIAVGAGLARSIAAVVAASLLAEPLHDLPRGLVLCFSGVAISAAAAVHGDVVCSRYSAPCMVARQRSLEVRGRCGREWTASTPTSWSEAGYIAAATWLHGPEWW